MTVDLQFNSLHEKLQQLLKHQNRLIRENESLQAALVLQKGETAKAKNTIAELTEQAAILKMAAGDMNEKDKKEFELKINRYIREIENCIAYLGQ
ncbi:MAG: hypothetical protein WKF70_09070 [Chitinophagaceae bacterium]